MIAACTLISLTCDGAPGMAMARVRPLRPWWTWGSERHVAEILTVTAGSVLCPEHVVTVIKAIKGESADDGHDANCLRVLYD
jgi:hypothetical protein